MIKKQKITKDLPFIEDKIYKTKFQTGDMFHLKKIVSRESKVGDVVTTTIVRFDGIYVNAPHLGICPLGGDRLVPEVVEDGEIDVCGHCGEKIN